MEKHILFDLDGTLTDSGPGILNSFDYALNKMNLKLPADFNRREFIGPPLSESFGKFCGFQGEELQDAIRYYREYFSENGIFENVVYPGIEELLCKLKENGYRLYIATSKPEVFAKRIAEHFKLSKYFDFIAGSLLEGGRGKKQEVIQYVLDENHITDRNRILMIGDRKYDVTGAAEFGIKTIGVSFGYGGREELEYAGAYRVADDTEELFTVISDYFEA